MAGRGITMATRIAYPPKPICAYSRRRDIWHRDERYYGHKYSLHFLKRASNRCVEANEMLLRRGVLLLCRVFDGPYNPPQHPPLHSAMHRGSLSRVDRFRVHICCQ